MGSSCGERAGLVRERLEMHTSSRACGVRNTVRRTVSDLYMSASGIECPALPLISYP